MKKLFVTLILLFSVLMFSSTSFAKWVNVAKNDDGTRFFIDDENIRVHGGYVYYWRMDSSLKPDEYGDLSLQIYYQGDCNKFRVKTLTYIWFKGQMGKGSAKSEESANKNWKYPSPGTVALLMLKRICAYSGR